MASAPLRIALEWYLNPDHLPLLAAARAMPIQLIAPDDHYDGFEALARHEADLVVNEPLHLIEPRDLPLRSLGTFFQTDGGILMTAQGLARLAAGQPLRIASPVSSPFTDGLAQDILAGHARTHGLPAPAAAIEAAGFHHVDNLAAGFDGAWLAFANVEGVDARVRGLDCTMITTAAAGLPEFSALELIARADADDPRHARLVAALDDAIPALRADPQAARALWYAASGEAPTPSADAIVADTLTRLVAPVRPDATRWRPMHAYAAGKGSAVPASAFEAMFA